MGRRLAFVVNALAGDELSGGRIDTTRVYTLLCDEELGNCDPLSPPPLQDCKTRGSFQDALLSLIEKWQRKDQLILYFSGHGKLRNDKYTLVFGEAPNQSYLPFDAITADLQAYGVDRAIIILDACHSGAALRRGTKAPPTLEPPRIVELPKGIAVLASCRESESSYELEDGSGSVFTHLFAEGIRSGLGGRPTDDGLIGPGDIITYINEMLQQEPYASYPQSSVFGIDEAERRLWLSHNRSTQPEPAPLPPTRTVEDLRLLYEMTEKSRWPCKGATAEHLDDELVRTYAQAFTAAEPASIVDESLARRLGLYSAISESDLHRAAVLCFTREPQHFVHQARAVFTVGSRTSQLFRREDILGPLPRQVARLFELVQREIAKEHGHTDYSDSQHKCLKVVREAISNAITHRNYDDAQIVRVSVDFPRVEIFSPGSFPHGRTFEALLEAEHVSAPKDAAIALYMTSLLGFEGVGRGFSVFEEYVRHTDSNHLRCSTDDEFSFIKLEIVFPGSKLDSVDTLTGDPTGPGARLEAGPAPLLPSRYVVERMLGQGGLGAVYEARDNELGCAVAIKVLSARYESTEAQSRLSREARILASVQHPGVVRLIDYGREGDVWYIAMEHLQGQDLRQWIAQARSSIDASSAEYFRDVARIVGEVATTLAFIHSRGVVHRDIKPSNIYIDQLGKSRIIDFGVAKWTAEAEPVESAGDGPRRLDTTGSLQAVTATGGPVQGTPIYMSPEQMETSHEVDARSDVYSLGLVLFELLAHERPIEGKEVLELVYERLSKPAPHPRSRNPRVPRRLDAICVKALQRSVSERYQAADDMAKELRDFVSRWVPRADEVEPEHGDTATDPGRTSGLDVTAGVQEKGVLAWIRRRIFKVKE